MKIIDCEIGSRLKITGFESGDNTYRGKLLAIGLTKRAEFTLVRVAPLGDPIEIKLINGGNVSLRKEEANALKVEKI